MGLGSNSLNSNAPYNRPVLCDTEAYSGGHLAKITATGRYRDQEYPASGSESSCSPLTESQIFIWKAHRRHSSLHLKRTLQNKGLTSLDNQQGRPWRWQELIPQRNGFFAKDNGEKAKNWGLHVPSEMKIYAKTPLEGSSISPEFVRSKVTLFSARTYRSIWQKWHLPRNWVITACSKYTSRRKELLWPVLHAHFFHLIYNPTPRKMALLSWKLKLRAAKEQSWYMSPHLKPDQSALHYIPLPELPFSQEFSLASWQCNAVPSRYPPHHAFT